MRVELITAEAAKYEGECRQVILPGVGGEMGLLPGHVALVSMTDPGIIRIDLNKGELHYAVSQGFVTVSNDVVVILVDAALELKDVKTEEVRNRLYELESGMANEANVPDRTRTEVKFLRAQLALSKFFSHLQLGGN